jgi:hypothetical protein
VTPLSPLISSFAKSSLSSVAYFKVSLGIFVFYNSSLENLSPLIIISGAIYFSVPTTVEKPYVTYLNILVCSIYLLILFLSFLIIVNFYLITSSGPCYKRSIFV